MSYRKFQILRGNKANLPTLSDGEMAFCSDTKELYIGSGGTNRRIGDSETAYGVATGTNNYLVTVDKQLSTYTAGLMVNFLVQNVNTTATTLNVNGLGVKNIYKNVDEPVSAGSFRTGQIVSVVYDGTNFQLLSGSGGGISLPVYDNVVANTSTNTVVFDILGFDSTRDVLLVYANSTFIQVGVDYSISGSSIVKTSGTWASGTIFNFVCFQMVDGTPDGLGIANIDSSFTATANGTTNCSLNTANYNPLSDILYVYYQNIILFEGVDYTVSVDGMSIILISFTIDTGEVLRYKILKKVRQNLYETDGTMIQNGTVSNAKLATDIKVGSLSSLATDNKSTVVDAINEVETNLNLVQLNLWKTIYPVGCLFETTDSAFNPQTHFGGTWEQYGAGRVTVGYSAGETEFNAGGKTGGAKAHTLTVAELAQHDHGVSSTGTGGGTIKYDGGYIAACETSSVGWSRKTTGSGNSLPHNNLQPYITVFRWRRTA